MTDPSNEPHASGYLFEQTSTDVVQEQTRRRILRENETYLQQQARLKRERRKDFLFVLLGCLFFAAFFTWQAWRAGR